MTKLERLREIVEGRTCGETSVEELAYVFAALPELLAVVDAYRERDDAREHYNQSCGQAHGSERFPRYGKAIRTLTQALAKLEADDG